MKYTPVEIEHDIPEGLFYKQHSEDGRWEIAIHPVIFGFRIVVSPIGLGVFDVNYCAGDELEDIERIYATVLTALTNDIDPRRLPVQDRKPMCNDPDCWSKLLTIIKDMEIVAVPLPMIRVLKAAHLTSVWSPKT